MVSCLKYHVTSLRQELELQEAIAIDQAIRAEALQRGLEATQPLSVARLAELCEIGERMQASAARVLRATRDLDAVLS
ncbi:MAG: hypothetical protein V4669_15390 [Pseudomonadota bacterium]